MATLIVKPSNTLGIKIQRVKKAYLAKKEIKGSEKTGETHSYTFKGTNSTSTKARKEKIATIIYEKIKSSLQKSKQQTTVNDIVEVLEKDSYTKGDCIDIPLTLPKIKFTKLTSASLGDEVYIVVETENMSGREIKMNLKQGGDKKVLAEVKKGIYVTQKSNKQASLLFTATVGEFAKKENCANAKDYIDQAIAKVKLQSTKEDRNKEYREALNKAVDKKALLYISMDAEPEKNDWFSVKYEEVFDNRPNLWYYGEGNWFELKDNSTLEYNIYSNGKIEKNKIKKPKEVLYNYYDAKGNKHRLGETKLIEVDKWQKKNIKKNPIEKTLLLDARQLDKYSSKEVNYGIVKWSTSKKRYYINPDCFAGLIGAMIEEGIVDLGSTGFSDINGSPGNSTSHINGEAGDLRYLSTNKDGGQTYLQHSHFDYERQVKFNNALYKFGWGREKKMLSENFERFIEEKEVLNPKTKKKEKVKITKTTLLPHTQHYKTEKVRHYHHLHIFGFDFSKIKEV
ncbi:hypothetical protein [Tenacibaculum caenipelagi]|uniref:Uncharacterized protein n=1 Tax=Tenacibaculum caenipelagi TaxID=1325435 RepID=A0A4R6TJJ8_9FLAO|nr:hypothetical protein [Tenacibaculum caenipelagi]TDQ30351.1 hypothetical protein DFQ07_0694 [Tenacibaculum caenipelagi]